MALADLDSLIYEANDNKSTLYSIFFDMESAFPRVWTHLICTSLQKLGLRGQLPLLIQSYLHNRSFKVKIASHLSTPNNQDNSVPQGSPLSGTLFMIAINEVTKIIQPLSNPFFLLMT